MAECLHVQLYTQCWSHGTIVVLTSKVCSVYVINGWRCNEHDVHFTVTIYESVSVLQNNIHAVHKPQYDIAF